MVGEVRTRPAPEQNAVHGRCEECGHVWPIVYLPMELGKAARVLSRGALSGVRRLVEVDPGRRAEMTYGSISSTSSRHDCVASRCAWNSARHRRYAT